MVYGSMAYKHWRQIDSTLCKDLIKGINSVLLSLSTPYRNEGFYGYYIYYYKFLSLALLIDSVMVRF